MLDRSNKNLQILLWLTLALLAHLLLLIGFTLQFVGTPVVEAEDKSLPAYFYHDDTPRPTPTSMPTTTDISPPPEPIAASASNGEKASETDPNGILPAKKISAEQQPMEQEGKTKNYNYKVPTGAINFKEKTQVDRPLLRILSKATAAKLFFPKIAQDFQIRGTAKIRFLITPEGIVSEVTLVESSGAGVLDQAALATINAISPVSDVGPYLKEPQYLVVALIYG